MTTQINIVHERLGENIGSGHGKDIYMAVPSERDDNNLVTSFTPADQGLQKLVKVSIEPSQANLIEVADDLYLKFNYENTHASSSFAVADFWSLVSCLTIKENNHTILETTTNTVDEIWRCGLIGKAYDNQRFTNYVTNNADDFNEYETVAGATDSSVKHYVSLNDVTNNYFKDYILNNVRRLDIYLQFVNTGLANTSACFHYINITADADISASIEINNLELCVKAKKFANPAYTPMLGQTTKHIMHGYEEQRYTIDADPVTGSTGFVTINLKNDFTHKKFVDRVYFYSIVTLGAFNTTTGMVNAHKYIDYINVQRKNKPWILLSSYPEKLIHMSEALERESGETAMFNAVAHFTCLPYSFVDFTCSNMESHHKSHIDVIDGIRNGREEITVKLGNNLTTSAHVTLVALMRYKRVITKRPGNSTFIDVDE